MTRIWRSLAVLALLVPGGLDRPLQAEPPAKREGVTCRHWAVLLPEDAGQHRVYDGIRKGLELAQLERVCLKEVEDTEASFRDFVAWHATLPKPEPLVFAIGRRAGARLVAAGYAGPGVLVSTEVTAKGEPLAPEPALGPRMARVRAEVPAEVWGAALRELLGRPHEANPVVALQSPLPDSFEDFPGGASFRAGQERFAASARAELRPEISAEGFKELVRLGNLPGAPQFVDPSPPPPPDAVLYLRLSNPGELQLYDGVREQAAKWRVPLLSDDPARFGAGATLVIVPDHQRVGRMAAEAGRRLWRNEPDALGAPLVVRTTEVWVDLVAALEIGLEPPLTFLAAADRVRAPPRKAPAPAPGAPGGSQPGSPPSAPR